MRTQMTQLLETGDVAGLRHLWARVAPNLPQPKTDAAAEITMHHARTQAQSVTFPKRAYSHAWLTERGLPSGLPDLLKPKAERMYPHIVEGVGIAVKANGILKPAAGIIRKAMEDAVNDAYADGHTDPSFVKTRMQEARVKAVRSLIG